MDLGGVRTWLGVALKKEDALLGAIWSSAEKFAPPLSRSRCSKTSRRQAVIAMENARLLGELRQRTDEVAELNRGLEARVAEQVDELGSVEIYRELMTAAAR